jgi:hypothetical protein
MYDSTRHAKRRHIRALCWRFRRWNRNAGEILTIRNHIAYFVTVTSSKSVASSLMGAAYGIGVDVDAGALGVARENFARLDVQNVDLVYSDVQTVTLSTGMLQ